MSTAWLWERLGDGAGSRRKLISEPTHISKEAGTQHPAPSCPSSSPPPPSDEHTTFCCGVGWESNAALPTQGQLSKGQLCQPAAWARGRGPCLQPQVSMSQLSTLTFSLAQANTLRSCKRSVQPSPQEWELLFGSNGTGFLSGC